MAKRVSLVLMAALVLFPALPSSAGGHWALAFWRSLNKEENASNLFVRIWTFDENGNPVGNTPITTPNGTLLATTESSGRADFPMSVSSEYQCKVGQVGTTSDVSPYMSNGRYPEWGHYSYELGFMYKSDLNNGGTFDTGMVGGEVPRKGGTSGNAPCTRSMAYYSFNPAVWDSDVGCRVLPGGGWGEHGQTFVPNGNRVACVQFHPTVGGVNVLMSFTVEIRQGGPTGPVIASRTSSPHYNQDWWVVPFGTSACPVTPGQTYFARVYTSGGFNAYYMNTDFYPNGLANGQAYWRANSGSTWGFAENPDLKGFIVCCNYEETAPVFVSGINANPDTGSAIVTWNTDVPATSQVEYGLTSAYGKSVSSPALVTSHSVTIPGLRGDTQYHFRITSTAPGHREGCSSDLTFITDSANPNLLQNGGFEAGVITQWSVFGQFSNPSAKSPLGVWCTGKCPAEGIYDLVSIISYGKLNGGAFQRVSGLVPGATYTARMTYYTWQRGGADSDVACQLGIDPYGGINPDAVSIVKTPELSSQDTWATAAVSAVAQGERVTVYLRAIQRWALEWNHNGFDDIRLTGPLGGGIPAVKGFVDGTLVSITGKTVTATAGQVGAYYVQEPGRQSGIRVEATSGSAAMGQVVNATGWMTTVDGERVVFDAIITPVGSGSAEPLAMINRSVGGVGPSTTGLLIRTFGKVTSKSAAEFYLTDGSGDSVAVDASAAGTLPGIGDFVAVTGICRQKRAGAGFAPWVKLRQSTDWTRVD